MTQESSQNHDAMISLLWELKALWQASTGKEILLTGLLVEKKEFDRFLADAARIDEPRIRSLVARIIVLRASLKLDPDSSEIEGSSRTISATPSRSSEPGTSTKFGGGGFAALRGGAALMASLLLSAAAGRYLYSSGSPADSLATASIATAAVIATSAEMDPVAHPQTSAALDASKSVGENRPEGFSKPATATLADSDIILRIHGSNTVGEKLCPSLVEAFLKTRGATDVTTIAGSAAVEKTLIARIPGRPRPVAIEIRAHGSSTAFVDLASGSADLGQSSRRIKPEEVAVLIDKHGDLSKPGNEHVVALDGLAVIVHPQNKLASLSIEQIAEIFAGKIKDWSQLGATSGPITLYARDDASGTWDTFKNLVLVPAKLDLDASAHRIESSSDLSDAVAGDPNGIGFIGLPYVRRSKLLAVSAQEGGFALLPTPFTVGTEDYPLSRRLYFYTPAHLDNPTMRDFVDFALADAGQEVVKQVGFVSQNVVLEKPRIDAGAPIDYRDAALDAERLSINFRFEAGSENLDAKALRDLDRVVEFLSRNSGREIHLLGFTDDRGNARTNVALSKKRGEVVARALESRGVFSRDAHGLGAALPVATNATEEGRNRNRRVEVWVR